jgi:hypothetical protein
MPKNSAEAVVEVSTIQYEDEDGHLDVFPSPPYQRLKKSASNSPLRNVLLRPLSKRVALFCVQSSILLPANLAPSLPPQGGVWLSRQLW